MISSIKLENFRSHINLDLSLDSEKIAIVGNNAVGKTNVLEAIYYAFITKPFNSNQKRLINNNSDYCKINTIFKTEKFYHLEYRLRIQNNHLKRIIKLNDVVKKASDIIGLQPVVIFLPEDTRVITDSPSYRRNMLNSVLIQTSKQYLSAINKFQKILNQRNQLLYNLKQNKTKNSADQLFVYNLQLAEPISKIYYHRNQFIDFINQKISEQYSLISSNNDKVHLEYLNTLPKAKDDIIRQLENHTQDDIRLGFTSRGPHKDELIINLNGYNSRGGLSRGENRSLTLALKIVELEYIFRQTQLQPILLLDDVLSELDGARQSHLLESTKAKQTIITSTTISPSIKNYKVIEI